jgi:hypothetical protein
LQNYAGVYENDYYGPVEILRHNDKLVLKIGPKDLQYPLQHWNGSVFVYAPDGENAPDGSLSAVTFTMGSSGHASAFSNEFYLSSGRSEFIRR